MNILIAILFLLVPAPIIWLNNRYKAVQKLGVVMICYLLGMIVGNLGILPESFSGIQTTLQDVSVCLALPLILFSIDIKQWLKTAKKSLFCMLLAVISIAIVVFILQLIFGSRDPEAPKYAALAMGVYTGGTPNIASIKTAIGVIEDDYIIFNTYDTVVSMIYVLFLTSFATKFFRKVFRLRAYEADSTTAQILESYSDEDNSYKGIFKRDIFGRLVIAFLLSAAIVGVSYVAGTFVKGYETAVTILLITTLSIACSFIKPIRNTKKTTPAGMYIIYIFCFTVATMADFSKLVHLDYTILIYVLASILGSLMIHALLCKFAKIDSDTMIVTSVSAICSPPFVPVVAGALKNKAILVSGITTGIVGYAIGNYLGIATYWLFERLPF